MKPATVEPSSRRTEPISRGGSVSTASWSNQLVGCFPEFEVDAVGGAVAGVEEAGSRQPALESHHPVAGGGACPAM